MVKHAWRWLLRRSAPSCFGNIAIVVFVMTQFLDGMFTYWAVSAWGLSVEGNPLVSWIMSVMGISLGLISIKLMAVGFGLLLFHQGVHNAVIFLSVLYLWVAVIPWVSIFWMFSASSG